ncbi:type VI secretion system baseplate subunit TssG [Azohydromonas caseinilytica]|uniref:Type VI secretion system baseplate subunit TssG n=1 Tax=Azohydromonas caseinilytica TaxID=2728836 RepID=A0A848FAH6_9BURK|nr:type VI secretion system baseplate subunit TssG [Azohydromonas caseinilytica]NML16544.1 type VI secretion system baseplate subunit TssG [Azohydromonas caseinilytica]
MSEPRQVAADPGRAGTDERHAAVQALHALLEQVRRQPDAFDFFALLRQVENLAGGPRLGTAPRPALEPLRLGELPELDFAPAALMQLDTAAAVPRLGVRFFGLLGPQGPMPLHLTEFVRERLVQRNDPTLLRFLDLFHHRLLLLFYRAWAQAQPVVQHDRPDDDRFAVWLGALAGVDGAARAQDAVPQQARLFQAGWLSERAGSAEGLEKLLAQYLGVPARIEQFVPHWLRLPREERTRLGYARNRVERLQATAVRLGENASAGSKVWDRQYRFRIVLGPLTLAQYRGFLPGGDAWAPLRGWVREYIGQHLQWELRLVLAREEVPPARPGSGVQLGFTTWLGPAQPRDRGELRLRDHAFSVHRPTGAAP